MLRISLALIIFLFHSQMHFHCSYGILNRFVSVGAITMTAFFMLSGYVLEISNNKLDLSNISTIKTFYIKRLISIMPLYLFIHLVRMFVWNTESISNRIFMFPIQTLGIQSQFSTLFSHAHNGGSWFISCLLACYFVFPLMHTLIKALSGKNILLLLGLLVFIMLWSPIVQIKLGTNSIYDNPFFRFIEFSIGISLYHLRKNFCENNFYRILSGYPIMIIATITLICGISLSVPRLASNYMAYNWLALPCFIILILNLGNHPLNSLKNSFIIKYAGSISFTFYLAQMLALWPSSRKLLSFIGYDNNTLRIIISFSLCLIFAILLHELIEVKSAKYLKAKLL